MDSENKKRVAKNTLILYFRMFITMFIGIWTSRLVLNALGFTDQGLYNVVGGFVGLLSLLTASISSSISRFITFEIGKGDYKKVNKVIQNAFTVQWSLAALVLLVAETVGLWFLNHELVIPENRLYAVNVVYQMSIGSAVISLLCSAPNALIIAHEKMSVYAWVAIIGSLGALSIALAISCYGGDRLILYALLQFIWGCGTILFYTIYTRRSFKFFKYGFRIDRQIFWPIFTFAGWNGIGTAAAILRGSGTGILLNIFGGPIANTINGIANSVNNLVTIFVSDFTTAYSPQITKQYAAKNYDTLIPFLHQCSKFSFFLMTVVAVPIFINIKPLLILWLKDIPEGTSIFARLIIIYSLIECICRPLITAKNATGKIRNYQLVVGGILLLTLPLTYLFLKLGLPIYFSYISIIITSSLAVIARMVMLKDDIPNWSSWEFVRSTISRSIFALLLSFTLPLIVHIFMVSDDLLSVLFQCIIGFLWSCGIVYFVGCNQSERLTVKRLVGILTNKVLHLNG